MSFVRVFDGFARGLCLVGVPVAVWGLSVYMGLSLFVFSGGGIVWLLGARAGIW